MVEYRDRKTGEIKTKDQLKSEFKNMSIPSGEWNKNVLDAMNVDLILRGTPAKTTAYQVSVRDSIYKDSKGNWVEKYVAKDMFSATKDEDGKTITKKTQEKNYQKKLDDAAAANVRTERNLLLKECDWTVLADSPLSTTKQNEWKAYRKTLRDIPSNSSFPHSVTFPTKPS